MKVKASNRIFAIILIQVSILSSCAKQGDTDPGTSSPESNSEIVVSMINGFVSIGNMITGAMGWVNPQKNRSYFAKALEFAFPILPAIADTSTGNPCSMLTNGLLAGCTSFDGVFTHTLQACQFQKPDGLYFYDGIWNGNFVYKFLNGSNSAGLPYCPTVGSYPLTGQVSGTGSAYPVNVTRTTSGVVTKTYPTTNTVVTVTTENLSAWKVGAIPATGGEVMVFNIPSGSSYGKSLTLTGIKYTAVKSYLTSQGVSKTATTWNFILTGSLTSTFNSSTNTHTTQGTVIIYDNLNFTSASVTFAGITHNHSTCGCLPTGGTVTTGFFEGSKVGTETLSITGCGRANFTNLAGVTSSIQLTHCL